MIYNQMPQFFQFFMIQLSGAKAKAGSKAKAKMANAAAAGKAKGKAKANSGGTASGTRGLLAPKTWATPK